MSATHALPSPAARSARLPGGLAAELLAHQAHRESRVRPQPRHLPIATAVVR
jgi:hypothetical protein